MGTKMGTKREGYKSLYDSKMLAHHIGCSCLEMNTSLSSTPIGLADRSHIIHFHAFALDKVTSGSTFSHNHHQQETTCNNAEHQPRPSTGAVPEGISNPLHQWRLCRWWELAAPALLEDVPSSNPRQEETSLLASHVIKWEFVYDATMTIKQ
jgi:hypothetical protein